MNDYVEKLDQESRENIERQVDELFTTQGEADAQVTETEVKTEKTEGQEESSTKGPAPEAA